MVLIRKADLDDAAAIAHVQVQSWRTTYAGIVPDAFLAEMSEREQTARWQMLLTDDNVVLVAERERQIMGFTIAGASRERAEGCDAELYAIYLHAVDQGLRIGTELLRETARALSDRGFTSMDVWVLAENSAKRFYLRRGAHYAAAKEIEIGGARLVEEGFVWPDLKALASLP
jgi:ribosomal protein S18 acetylase RimI-like enzyme